MKTILTAVMMLVAGVATAADCPCCSAGTTPSKYEITFGGFTGPYAYMNGKVITLTKDEKKGPCVWSNGDFAIYQTGKGQPWPDGGGLSPLGVPGLQTKALKGGGLFPSGPQPVITYMAMKGLSYRTERIVVPLTRNGLGPFTIPCTPTTGPLVQPSKVLDSGTATVVGIP